MTAALSPCTVPIGPRVEHGALRNGGRSVVSRGNRGRISALVRGGGGVICHGAARQDERYRVCGGSGGRAQVENILGRGQSRPRYQRPNNNRSETS